MLNIKEVGFEGLEGRLRDLESRYGMTSAEFHRRFLENEFSNDGDDELVFWAGLYEMYLRLAPIYQREDALAVPAE